MASSDLYGNREGISRGAEGNFRSTPGTPETFDSAAVQGASKRGVSEDAVKLSDMMKSYRGWWNLPRKSSGAAASRR